MDMMMQLLLQAGAAAQTAQARPAAETAGGGTENEGSSFQTMLEEKQQAAEPLAPAHPQKQPAPEEAPADVSLAELAAMLLAGQPAAVSVVPLSEAGEGQNAAVTVLDLTALQAAVPAAAAQPPAEGALSQAAESSWTAIPQTQTPQSAQASEGQARPAASAPDMPVQTAGKEAPQGGGEQHQTETGTGGARQEDLPEITRSVSSGEGQPVFQQVEHMPVKVGEAPQLDTTAADFDAQAAKTIAEAFRQGQQTVELKLSPENLGSVTVSLSKGTDGALHVVLTAESEHTLRLLTEHTGQLGLLLQSSSQGEVRVEVSHPQESQQPWQQPDSNGERQQGGYGRHPEQNRQQDDGESFLQQLRLGLLEPNGAA